MYFAHQHQTKQPSDTSFGKTAFHQIGQTYIEPWFLEILAHFLLWPFNRHCSLVNSFLYEHLILSFLCCYLVKEIMQMEMGTSEERPLTSLILAAPFTHTHRPLRKLSFGQEKAFCLFWLSLKLTLTIATILPRLCPLSCPLWPI